MKTEINEDQTRSGDSPEVAELKQKIFDAENRLLSAGLTAEVGPEIDALVAEKMRAGLSRADAIECAQRNVLSQRVSAERDALIKTVTARVDKDFEGKDKRLPEYKQAMAGAISEAVAAGKFHEKFVAAGAHQLNPGVIAAATN